MYPNISGSKSILCKRNPYKTISDIKRGDIVVFKAEWKDRKKHDFIWRVMALPSEKIFIQDKKIVINGNDLKLEEARKENNYVIYKETNGETTYEVAYFKERNHQNFEDFQCDIPENHVFVLGDNRDNASDSREIGTVPFESIIAKKL
jgi:signal peptidase I